MIQLNLLEKDHPELTEEQVIQYYLTPKKKSFRQKCIDANINYHTAQSFRRRNQELTDEQIIQYCTTKVQKGKPFSQKCIDANINYGTAFCYRKRHPELTDEQVIIHIRSDCYINIFGELVIP